MSILVVGSVALDSVETPFGKVDDAVGGSATFFSTSASYFAPVRVVAIVGEDYPMQEIAFLKDREVDFAGLQMVKGGKTFRWGGKYSFDLNDRETLYTHLNVFENFRPVLPDRYKDSPYVFLGNIDPDLQWDVLQQVRSPKLVVLDTMNFWISGKPASLRRVLSKVDVFVLNDSEARQLSGQPNLFKAAREIFAMGPRVLVIKKGEHGALLITKEGLFFVPAFPLEEVCDPTGAGDTFAGGFVGYLASVGDLSDVSLRRATVYGSAMASFCVEDFSLRALQKLTPSIIYERCEAFRRLSHFDMK